MSYVNICIKSQCKHDMSGYVDRIYDITSRKKNVEIEYSKNSNESTWERNEKEYSYSSHDLKII